MSYVTLRSMRSRRWTLWFGLGAAALTVGVGHSQSAIAAEPVAPAAVAAANKPAAAPTVDFAAVLFEVRSAVTQVAGLRKSASAQGDKIKEACLYERLRALSQTAESTQIARVAWESASERSDAAAMAAEKGRAQKALELAQKLRSDAENCVGSELRPGAKETTVTVNSDGASDDKLAGPSELWSVRPVRLELPSRPNPASAFRPSR